MRGLRADEAAMDFSRLAFRVGIDKHSAAALAKSLGKFRGELMAGDDFNILAGEGLGKQTAGVPAKPIVTPQWIAVADDQSPVSESGVRSPCSPDCWIRISTFPRPVAAFGFRARTSDLGLRTASLTPQLIQHRPFRPEQLDVQWEPVRKHGWSN